MTPQERSAKLKQVTRDIEARNHAAGLHTYVATCESCNAARAAAPPVEPTGLMTHCPGCDGWVEEEYLHREECPGVGIEFDDPPPPDPVAGLREADQETWRQRIVEHLGPQRMSLYMSKDIDRMATGAVIAAALLDEPVPPSPVAGLREAAESAIRLLSVIHLSADVEQADMQAGVAVETLRAALLDEPVPPKSPYRDADEHERQSLAGTHLFDAACFWCLLGWYEHPPEAEPVPLDVERLAQTGVNVWGWDISRARQYAEQFAAEYARLTDPKGATE